MREPTDDLDRARAEIDALDRRIIEALAERMLAVDRVAACKSHDGDAEIRDHEREAHLRDLWSSRARTLGLDLPLAESVLEKVLQASRRRQRVVLGAGHLVAIQGESDSWSAHAVATFESRELCRHPFILPCSSFAETARAVQSGQADFAVLPVANTILGRINEATAAAANLVEIGQADVEIRHVVAAVRGGTPEGLRRLRSHPIALLQCRRFLAAHPKLTVEPWSDTAAAARTVAAANDASIAALCSRAAADTHDLVVLDDDVADVRHLVTTFALFAGRASINSA